jgi:hypothetical protein
LLWFLNVYLELLKFHLTRQYKAGTALLPWILLNINLQKPPKQQLSFGFLELFILRLVF